MARTLVGSCSWTDPTLIACGRFYPQGVSSAEDRLRFYARQFPLVEVDSTYYAPPSERNSRLWVERTPEGFTFNVKAYGLLTGHPARTERLPRLVARRRRRPSRSASATSIARTSTTTPSSASGRSTGRRSNRCAPPASSARSSSSSRRGSCAAPRTRATCATCRNACPASPSRSSSAAAAGWTARPRRARCACSRTRGSPT